MSEDQSKITPTADASGALGKWIGTVTHILDTLADAYGLQIDRQELIDSYNQISGEAWTTDFVRKAAGDE